VIKIVRVKPPEGAIVSTFKRRGYDYQNDVGAAICCDWVKTVWSPRGPSLYLRAFKGRIKHWVSAEWGHGLVRRKGSCTYLLLDGTMAS
jgi:hypothetical protein